MNELNVVPLSVGSVIQELVLLLVARSFPFLPMLESTVLADALEMGRL